MGDDQSERSQATSDRSVPAQPQGRIRWIRSPTYPSGRQRSSQVDGFRMWVYSLFMRRIVAASFDLGLLVACGGAPGAPPTSPLTRPTPGALPPGPDRLVKRLAGQADDEPEPVPRLSGPSLSSNRVNPSLTGPGVTGLWIPPEAYVIFSLSQSGASVPGEPIVAEQGSSCGDLSGSASGNTLTLTLIVSPANCPLAAELDEGDELDEGPRRTVFKPDSLDRYKVTTSQVNSQLLRKAATRVRGFRLPRDRGDYVKQSPSLRTFSWLGRCRRLANPKGPFLDFEFRAESMNLIFPRNQVH